MYGAELSLDIPVPTTNAERSTSARAGAADPPGRHLLVLARDPTGYASLCRAISAAQRRGGAKGRPVYDLDELTGLADGHWLVLTGCRKGPVRPALESGGFGTLRPRPGPASPGRAGRAVRSRQRRRRAQLRPRPARRRALRRARRAGRRAAAADRRHHGRALPRPVATTARHGDGRGTGPTQPAGDGRLAAGVGRPAAAYRRGDGAALRPLARCGRDRGPARGGAGVLDPPHRAGAAAVPGAGRAHRDDLPARAHRRAAPPSVTARASRTTRRPTPRSSTS